MIFLSAANTAENVPVSIFCHNGQRKFLRVLESYDAMLHSVASAFNINVESITLSTVSLPACNNGGDVIVDPSAYPLLWPYLEEVNVKVSGADLSRRSHEQAEVSIVSRRSPTPPPIDAPLVALPSVVARPESIQTQHAPYRPPSEVFVFGDPTVGPANASINDSQREVDEVANQTLEPHIPNDPLLLFNDPPSQVEEHEYRHEHNEAKNDESDYHEEERAPTPSPPPQHSRKFKPTPFIQTSEPEALRIKKEKSRELVAKEIEAPAITPSESYQSQSVTSPSKREGNRRIPVVDTDARFELTIQGPEPHMLAQFKLRGKNSVRKVLAAACKNFELDMERARLIQLVETEEDGEYFTDEFALSPEETMAACGIDARSRLYIKVDSFSEEEDYERARLAYGP